MDRGEALAILNEVLAKKDRMPVQDDDTPLREAGIKSLDFSEAALMVEDRIGRELNFGAGKIRRIRTVADIIDFFVQSTVADAEAV